jgi:hypothetical protein
VEGNYLHLIGERIGGQLPTSEVRRTIRWRPHRQRRCAENRAASSTLETRRGATITLYWSTKSIEKIETLGPSTSMSTLEKSAMGGDAHRPLASAASPPICSPRWRCREPVGGSRRGGMGWIARVSLQNPVIAVGDPRRRSHRRPPLPPWDVGGWMGGKWFGGWNVGWVGE